MSTSNFITFPDKQTIINHFDNHIEGFLVRGLIDVFPMKEKIAEAFQHMTMLPEQINLCVQKVFLLENSTYAYLNSFSEVDSTVPALLKKIARGEKEHYVYVWQAYTKALKDIADSTAAPKWSKIATQPSATAMHI
jgi:hypothetical protein